LLDPVKYRRRHVSRVGKLRDLLGLVMSLRLVTDPDSGVLLEYTPAGTRVSLDEAQELAVRITAVSGSAYAWNAVKADLGGGWTDMTSPAGTLIRDSAYEVNGVTASTPQVVWARREPWTARLVFQTETCS
jgi:hypothetical protein